MQEHINKLRGHRNILYVIVFVLLVLETATFVNLSSQVSKAGVELDKTRNELLQLINENKEDYQNLNELTNLEFIRKLREISLDFSKNISKQGETLKTEINLLKSTKEDFSGIIEEAVKGVVSIKTDRSAGSGFIVNSEGYVVTNAHVISKAQNVKVLLYDGRLVSAKIIGGDGTRDVALLKIEGEYSALGLADSDRAQVGKKVIAIGNPLGLSFTVTEGIISAVDREGPNGLSEYIQTDVSLNPGNSGGPLIDTQGKVIGMNNFKVGSAESLGFALESNVIRNVANKLANSTIIN